MSFPLDPLDALYSSQQHQPTQHHHHGEAAYALAAQGYYSQHQPQPAQQMIPPIHSHSHYALPPLNQVHAQQYPPHLQQQQAPPLAPQHRLAYTPQLPHPPQRPNSSGERPYAGGSSSSRGGTPAMGLTTNAPLPRSAAGSVGPQTPATGHAGLPQQQQGQAQASPSTQQQQQGHLLPKARSAMACTLCRKQKMKCEGPDKAPCRRCRAAGVDCVFEAPPAAPPRPRGTGVTEAWVESRFSQFEQRLASLEQETSSSRALVPTNNGSSSTPSSSSISPQIVTDHDRRIATLEAQLYALQLTVQRQQLAGGQQPRQSAQGMHDAQQQQQPAFPTFPANGGGAYGPALKHEASDGDLHRGKRWKGDLQGTIAEPGTEDKDFIARGLVSDEEAQMCFESSPSDVPHLSFDETRRRSPFFLCVVVSIGARALSRFDTFHATYREAMRLARLCFIPSAFFGESNPHVHTIPPGADIAPSSSNAEDFLFPTFSNTAKTSPISANGAPDPNSMLEPRLSTLSLKALFLLGLYHSLPELLAHSWMAGWRYLWPSAVLDFEQLSEEEKRGPVGRRLINISRVGFIGWLWVSHYTYVRGQAGYITTGMDVMRHRLDVLAGSVYAEQPTDSVIRTNMEGNFILLKVYGKLCPAARLSYPTVEEVFEVVKDAMRDVDEWNKRNSAHMQQITSWGDSPDLKSIVPFHHTRQWLLMYIFRDFAADKLDLSDSQTREFARMAVESALVILRWGVESRVWMPFSVIGGYVHNVNVPCALFVLSTCTRLYPVDTDYSLLRPLLHRLNKQCDATISGPAATPREIARAKKTKLDVQELDRWAFERGGEDDWAAPGGGGGGAPSSSSASAHGSATGEDSAGLFGHEVTASLESLRMELNLWAKPLRAFEEDD
ncbi:microtubule-associated protein [Rhodotorula toruloides]|uniref:Microtubule-associated protein n=1 Tax=Rhodotorula toruloides TaxID=5286 RepID=A0A511KL43_RHOTO|nr:microtubule-associated protein [Rhodotorula toruloides]